MAHDERKQRFRGDFQSNPAIAAAVLGAAGACLGLLLAGLNGTHEARQKFRERDAKAKRERRERQNERERVSLGLRLKNSYLDEGPGKTLYKQRAHIRIPAKRPFPDGTFERRPGPYGGWGFIATSASAWAQLSASYHAIDAMGSFCMIRPDSTELRGGASLSDEGLWIGAKGNLDDLIKDARLIARLIAAPGTNCAAVMLMRPDHWAIREAIWQEYLKENPHIAKAIGEG